MRRRRNAQEELRPVYVAPIFDARECAAHRDWDRAAYRGERLRPKPGECDPLWLRLGLRMHCIDARAGWVVSNPLYDESLRRTPAHDPSLPGPGWLRKVYGWHKSRDLVLLPRTRAAIERRIAALRTLEEPATASRAPAEQLSAAAGQMPLFSAKESE